MSRKSESPPLPPDTAEGAQIVPRRKIDPIEEQWAIVWGISKTQAAADWLWLKIFTDRERRLLTEDYGKLTPLALWQKVRRCTERQAAIALCTAIGGLDSAMGIEMLKRSGETPYLPPRDRGPLLEAAIEKGGLVIVEGRREVHWKKEWLDIDWFAEDRQWSFLLQLAKKALRCSPLDALTFLGENHPNLKAMSTVKMRLVQLEGFPADLKVLIQPSGKKQYGLKLKPGEIHIVSEDAAVVDLPPE